MRSKLNIFCKILEGNWASQKTIYYLKINQICSNQSNYSIYDIDTSHNNQYCLQYYKNHMKQPNIYRFNQTDQNNSGKIEKNENSSLNINNYKYSIYKNKCLKIQYITKNIEYVEYINTINEKLIMSIGFLKKSNKYIAISFSSDIKIKKNDSK